ncbi:NACHT domain-containing protein [Roseovarius indicus]|uniref:NACHT domain-containing protein n=1 Tax=Roseovarius indicus TaxID=540747 RepID=UPI0032ED1F2E
MPVESVVTGILSSIIHSGLRRPFQSFVGTHGRLSEIDRALTDSGDLDDPLHRGALDDLIKVIGNRHGEYSQGVKCFLDDLNNSAIPDALKEAAVIGSSTEGAYAAFELMYRSHGELPFDARKFFNSFNTAIQQRVKKKVEDEGILEILQAHSAELAGRIETLHDCMIQAQDIPPMSQRQYDALRLKTAKGIEQEHKQISVETTQGAKKVTIDKLVLPARLQLVSDEESFPSPHRDSDNVHRPTTSFLKFRREFKKAIILGDPGGGKTTLTQLLCFELSKSVRLQASNSNSKHFEPQDLQLPFRVVIRTFENRLAKDASYNLFKYLVDELSIFADFEEGQARSFIQQSLILGKAVLIFDGLDEVLNVAARRDMVRRIERFALKYSACPSLITSRIVGYRDAPIADDFQLLTLSRFNEAEVEKYSERFIRTVKNETASEAKESAKRFLRETETSASDLRVNPLLLGLMVFIFSVKGGVPNNRPEIYKECSLLMFEKWDQRRAINFEFPKDFDLLDLFGYLASEIFGAPETEEGVDEGWLEEKLRAFFDNWYVSGG